MAAPFFFAVVLTNAFDQGLRFSIDKATFELLYLPLPSHVKSGVKGAIDVLVSRVGDGVGGLLLGLATKGFAVGMIAIPGLGLGLRGLATCCAVGLRRLGRPGAGPAPRLRAGDHRQPAPVPARRGARGHGVHGSIGLGGAGQGLRRRRSRGHPLRAAGLRAERAAAAPRRRPRAPDPRDARRPRPGAGRAAGRPRPDDPGRGRAAAARSRHRGADRGAALAGVPRPGRSAGPDRRARRLRRLLDPRQHGRALQPARPLREPRSGAACCSGRWPASAGRKAAAPASRRRCCSAACPATSARSWPIWRR